MGAIRMNGMRATGQARKVSSTLPSVTNPTGMQNTLEGRTTSSRDEIGLSKRGGPVHMQEMENSQEAKRNAYYEKLYSATSVSSVQPVNKKDSK